MKDLFLITTTLILVGCTTEPPDNVKYHSYHQQKDRCNFIAEYLGAKTHEYIKLNQKMTCHMYFDRDIEGYSYRTLDLSGDIINEVHSSIELIEMFKEKTSK